MKKFFMALLSDQGNLSMTRFMSLTCVAAALVISIVCLFRGQAADSIVGLVSVFLGAGFGGKVVQSFAEAKQKSEPIPKPENEKLD